MIEKIEIILSQLTMSTPEVESFQFFMKIGDLKEVNKILKRFNLDEDEKEILFLYFKNKYLEKKEFVEIPKHLYETITDNETVLISFGGQIFSAIIFQQENKKSFYNDGYFFNLEQANQIWKINKKEI